MLSRQTLRLSDITFLNNSRKTLAYAIRELQRDIDILESQLSEEQRKVTPKTQLGLFVVHNKCVPTTLSPFNTLSAG